MLSKHSMGSGVVFFLIFLFWSWRISPPRNATTYFFLHQPLNQSLSKGNGIIIIGLDQLRFIPWVCDWGPPFLNVLPFQPHLSKIGSVSEEGGGAHVKAHVAPATSSLTPQGHFDNRPLPPSGSILLPSLALGRCLLWVYFYPCGHSSASCCPLLRYSPSQWLNAQALGREGLLVSVWFSPGDVSSP